MTLGSRRCLYPKHSRRPEFGPRILGAWSNTCMEQFKMDFFSQESSCSAKLQSTRIYFFSYALLLLLMLLTSKVLPPHTMHWLPSKLRGMTRPSPESQSHEVLREDNNPCFVVNPFAAAQLLMSPYTEASPLAHASLHKTLILQYRIFVCLLLSVQTCGLTIDVL